MLHSADGTSGQVRQHGRARDVLDIVASLAMILAAAALIWSNVIKPRQALSRRSTVSLPARPISIAGLPTQGRSSAPVVIVEFADFGCIFCRMFAAQGYPRLKEHYIESGKVLFVFRHLPLTALHPFADRAAASAVCAGRQGQFWKMHDLLFRDPMRLDDASLFGHAVALRLEPKEFARCMQETGSAVRADRQAAQQLGIQATPTFLVGTPTAAGTVNVVHVFTGARTIADLTAAVESLLHSR